MALVQASEKVKFRALRLYVLLLPIAVSAIGCSAFPRVGFKAPSAQIAAGSTQIAQAGAAQVPAAASVDTTAIEIPLSAFAAADARGGVARLTPEMAAPAGSHILTPKVASRDPETPVVESVPGAPTLKITTRRETATGPQAFTPPEPPKPPTANEQARADLIRWSGIGALALGVLAGLLAWAQHYLAALKVGAAAIALPLLANFFGSAVAMTVTGILLALGAGLWLAWGILKRKVSSGQNPFTAS